MEARPWTPDLDGAVMAFLGDGADGRGAGLVEAGRGERGPVPEGDLRGSLDS